MKHSTRLPSTRWLLISLLAAPLACGGSVDTSATAGVAGSGGAGTSSSSNDASSSASSGSVMTSSASSSSSSGGSDECGALGTVYAGTLQEARKCNACKDFDGCINGPVFPDLCGCPVAVDESNDDAVTKVKDAFAAWMNAGCQAFSCGQPCPAGNSFGCVSQGTCEGTCTAL